MSDITTAVQEVLGEWRDGDLADGEAAAAFYALTKIATAEPPITGAIGGVNWEDEYDQSVTYITELEEKLANAKDHETALKEQLGDALLRRREAGEEPVWEDRARDLARRITVKDDHLAHIVRSDNLKRLVKDVAREVEEWDK